MKSDWNYIKDGKYPEFKYLQYEDYFGHIRKSNLCLVLTEHHITHVGYYVELVPKDGSRIINDWWSKYPTVCDIDTDFFRIINVKAWKEMNLSPDYE